MAVNAAWLNDDHDTKLWLLAGSRIRSLTEARGLVPPPPEVVCMKVLKWVGVAVAATVAVTIVGPALLTIANMVGNDCNE